MSWNGFLNFRSDSFKIESDCLKINKKHVHKNEQSNVLIKNIVEISSRREYLSEIKINTEHCFFFEHESNHLPGLYIMEAGRQLGLAIPHLFFNIPYGSSFILDGCVIKFLGLASLHKPIFIKCIVFNPTYRKGKLSAMSFTGKFFQDEKEIVHYQSDIRIMSEKTLKRLERNVK